MAVSVSTAGPYYSSGEIKFSDLRRDFRAQQRKTTSDGSETPDEELNEGAISAAELIRVTDTTEKNPIVPDCTENRISGPLNSGIAATKSNWKVSQFRNSIKYYYITQSGTNENFDIDAQSWNSNLDKTINKIMFIDGTCGSNDASSPAASLDATAYNLTIDVSGSILGAGGRGGGTTGDPDDPISGEDGGDALSVSTTGNNVVVNVKSGAKIYGGGGGGEKGVKGDDGSPGSCYESETKTECDSCPSCPSGWSSGDCTTGWHCRRKMVWGCWRDQWWDTDGSDKTRTCSRSAGVNGGTGGDGGNGRHGRGYDYSDTLDVIDGDPGGSKESCPFGSYSKTPTDGDKGKKGGEGGDWCRPGGNTTNTGSGGAGGDAIIGSGYSVTGSTGSSNIKGSY